MTKDGKDAGVLASGEASAAAGQNGSGLLTRAAILDADDLRTEDVEVPEWGGKVRVRALTGIERDSYEASLTKHGKRGQTRVDFVQGRAKLVALTVVDEQDTRLFKQSDVEELGRKSGAALDRVWDVAARLAGIRTEDDEEAALGLEPDPSEPTISAGR